MSRPIFGTIQPSTGEIKYMTPSQAKKVAAESNHTCHNVGCSKSTNLRKCAKCKTALYCSPECQKAHWRLHKVPCRTSQYCSNLDEAQGLPEEGGPLGRDLRLWSSRFEFSLASAFIYGLDLRRNPTGNVDSAMIVIVKARPHKDPAARFVLEDVSFVPMDVFKLLSSQQAESVRIFLELTERERKLALEETNGVNDFGVATIIALDADGTGGGARQKPMPINWDTVRNAPAYDRLQARWKENFRAQIEHNMPNRLTEE